MEQYIIHPKSITNPTQDEKTAINEIIQGTHALSKWIKIIDHIDDMYVILVHMPPSVAKQINEETPLRASDNTPMGLP